MSLLCAALQNVDRGETPSKEAVIVMKLLRDNINLWNNLQELDAMCNEEFEEQLHFRNTPLKFEEIEHKGDSSNDDYDSPLQMRPLEAVSLNECKHSATYQSPPLHRQPSSKRGCASSSKLELQLKKSNALILSDRHLRSTEIVMEGGERFSPLKKNSPSASNCFVVSRCCNPSCSPQAKSESKVSPKTGSSEVAVTTSSTVASPISQYDNSSGSELSTPDLHRITLFESPKYQRASKVNSCD